MHGRNVLSNRRHILLHHAVVTTRPSFHACNSSHFMSATFKSSKIATSRTPAQSCTKSKRQHNLKHMGLRSVLQLGQVKPRLSFMSDWNATVTDCTVPRQWTCPQPCSAFQLHRVHTRQLLQLGIWARVYIESQWRLDITPQLHIRRHDAISQRVAHSRTC